VTSFRLRALAVMLLGLLTVIAVRVVAPDNAPPLYDSFVQASPYVYLHPSPGQPGNPQSVTKTVAFAGQDPGALVVATGENPPQAQLILAAQSLVVPAGTHSIKVSITPIDTPGTSPKGGVVAGNTYRFAIVTDSGAAVALNPDHPATLVLRGPLGIGSATVERFEGGAWIALTTNPVAGPDIFAANTAQLGDAALVIPPPPPAPAQHFGWLPWAAGGVALLIAIAVPLGLALRRRT
jgi:hypothetical protein